MQLHWTTKRVYKESFLVGIRHTVSFTNLKISSHKHIVESLERLLQSIFGLLGSLLILVLFKEHIQLEEIRRVLIICLDLVFIDNSSHLVLAALMDFL